MKTLQQLKLEKEVLNAQLDLINNQINNFGYDESKLKVFVGRYFQSGNTYIFVKETEGKKLKIKELSIQGHWIQTRENSEFEPSLRDGEYNPLKGWHDGAKIYTEIDKETFDNILKCEKDLDIVKENYYQTCKNILKQLTK